MLSFSDYKTLDDIQQFDYWRDFFASLFPMRMSDEFVRSFTRSPILERLGLAAATGQGISVINNYNRTGDRRQLSSVTWENVQRQISAAENPLQTFTDFSSYLFAMRQTDSREGDVSADGSKLDPNLSELPVQASTPIPEYARESFYTPSPAAPMEAIDGSDFEKLLTLIRNERVSAANTSLYNNIRKELQANGQFKDVIGDPALFGRLIEFMLRNKDVKANLELLLSALKEQGMNESFIEIAYRIIQGSLTEAKDNLLAFTGNNLMIGAEVAQTISTVQPPAPPATTDAPMSTGMKVAIGAFAVAGVGVVFAMTR